MKKILIAAMVMLAIVALVACNNNPSPSTPDTPVEPTTPEEPTSPVKDNRPADSLRDSEDRKTIEAISESTWEASVSGSAQKVTVAFDIEGNMTYTDSEGNPFEATNSEYNVINDFFYTGSSAETDVTTSLSYLLTDAGKLSVYLTTNASASIVPMVFDPIGTTDGIIGNWKYSLSASGYLITYYLAISSTSFDLIAEYDYGDLKSSLYAGYTNSGETTDSAHTGYKIITGNAACSFSGVPYTLTDDVLTVGSDSTATVYTKVK